MRWVRSIVHNRRSFARLIGVVALTLSVVVGLLAMHSATPTQHSQESTHTVAVGISTDAALPESAPAGSTPLEHCDCEAQDSAPMHSMLMVACVLALLATVLVLVPPAASRVTFAALRRIKASSAAWLRGALAPPRPPSLLVLSISRT